MLYGRMYKGMREEMERNKVPLKLNIVLALTPLWSSSPVNNVDRVMGGAATLGNGAPWGGQARRRFFLISACNVHYSTNNSQHLEIITLP